MNLYFPKNNNNLIFCVKTIIFVGETVGFFSNATNKPRFYRCFNICNSQGIISTIFSFYCQLSCNQSSISNALLNKYIIFTFSGQVRYSSAFSAFSIVSFFISRVLCTAKERGGGGLLTSVEYFSVVHLNCATKKTA